MKREKFLMAALVACGCLTLASCEKSTSGSDSGDKVFVNSMYISGEISELTSKSYAAADSKDDFFLDDQISVYAWLQDSKGDNKVAPAAPADYQVNNVINVCQSDASWLPEENMEYSADKTKYHTIVAIYPSQVAKVENSVIYGNKSFDPTNYDYVITEDAKPEDMLWAKRVDQMYQGPAVQMPFTHALSKVALTLNFTGNANTKSRNIKVELDAPTKANVNYTTQSIVADTVTSMQKFVVFNEAVEVGTGSVVSIDAVIIPHTLTTLYLTIGDGEAKEYKLQSAIVNEETGETTYKDIEILSGEQVSVTADVVINVDYEPITTTSAIAVGKWETGIVSERELTQAE